MNPLDIWLSIKVYSPEKGYFVAVFENITERKIGEVKIADLAKFPSENPHPVLRADKQDIMYINQAGKMLFEIEEGSNIPAQLKTAVENVFSKQIANENEIKFEDKIFSFIISPVKDKKYVNIYGRDVTDKIKVEKMIRKEITSKRKEAEQKLKESEEKYRLITEDSDDLIVVYNNRLKVEYLNEETHSRILGYESSKFRDNIFRGEIIHKEDLKDTAIAFQNGYKKGNYKKQFRLKRKDGKYLWFEVKGKVFLDSNGLKKILCVSRDITEMKESENELISLNKLKTEFLRRTSHELKTPLISIKGFADLLITSHSEKLDTDMISIVNEIKDGSQRLENLIKDLIAASKLESGQLQFITTKEDLTFLIRFCMDELKGVLQTKNQKISLEIHDQLITMFEKERIYEVITNLLINAIKYSPPNETIEIRSKIKENFYVISVKDYGIGITEDEKKRLFQQFGKIERYGQGWDLGIEGSGLGLYISKKIVELHGGQIWVESEGRNKGSTFYFSFPITND